MDDVVKKQIDNICECIPTGHPPTTPSWEQPLEAILQWLQQHECSECGEERGRHDADCTHDGGHGLLGDSPPYQGTSFLGFLQLAMMLDSYDWRTETAEEELRSCPE